MGNPEDDYSIDFSYPFLSGINPDDMPLTIDISEKYYSEMGNMERQYWKIKSKYYNILIFFKKGKFYELYDYDAVIAKKEFGLKMVFDTTNRGKMRLAGVPEQSFVEWARLFVFRGYKVGRVEQMKEDPQEGSKGQVVPRELVEIITPGTLKDPLMISDYKELFLLSIVPTSGGLDAFAIDLSRRVSFWCPCGDVGECHQSVVNEPGISALTNLLLLLRPREIIIPHPNCHPNLGLSKCTIEKIQEHVRSEMFHVDTFSCTLQPEEKRQPALHFLQKYLKYLKIDAGALYTQYKVFTSHKSLANLGAETNRCERSLLSEERESENGLFMDAQTISNLELVSNLKDQSEKGSFFEFVNKCVSNGGKRMLLSWMLRPMTSCKTIQTRQEAVRFLVSILKEPLITASHKRGRSDEDEMCGFNSRFSNLSFDLERQLGRLSDMKNENSNISYVDPETQIKKNLRLIFQFMDSITATVSWAKEFFDVYCKDGGIPLLLREIVSNICACEPAVEKVSGLFDRGLSEDAGVLIAKDGASLGGDAVKRVKEELQKIKDVLRVKIFGGADIQFSDVGKDIFLLEVQLKDAPKITPPGFIERARNSKTVKYIATDLQPLIEKFKTAKSDAANTAANTMRVVASEICNQSVSFFSAFEGISYFDCLLSLAKLRYQNEHSAFPLILETGNTSAFADFIALRHPLLGASAIPTGLCLNNTSGRILLLTGPNMAGKSTLMRSVAVNIILAQMGGPVFAEDMKFYPLTRIFTRIGARDATYKGKSTLLVELTEASTILHHADDRSLCLIDELGRGTSTHDGLAIASATLTALEKHTTSSPLTIFSTHYHTLAFEKSTKSSTPHSTVQLGFMAYRLSTDQLHTDPAESQAQGHSATEESNITFLYTLSSGICDRSFGIEVARMAALPSHVLQIARQQANSLLQKACVEHDLRTIALAMSKE